MKKFMITILEKNGYEYSTEMVDSVEECQKYWNMMGKEDKKRIVKARMEWEDVLVDEDGYLVDSLDSGIICDLM